MKVNGEDSANLTSDGGEAELVWKIGTGAETDQTNTICMASSSNGDWTGTKEPHAGHDVLPIAANTSQNVVSSSYTLNCSGIGMVTVTVNVAGVQLDTTSIIPGSSVSITANGVSSYDLSKSGGAVKLDWKVTLPASYTGGAPVCTAVSVEDPTDWDGAKSNVGSSTFILPGNTGLDIISNKYTISCTRVGDATATVNISGPSGENGGIIAGSSVSITANDKTSYDLTSDGGPVTLKWNVTLPAGYAGDLPVCTASSAPDINSWSGSKDNSGTDNVTLPANTNLTIATTRYTISCTRVGDATANVNVSGPAGNTTGIINGGINLTVNDTNFLFMDYNGGDATLKWNVDVPDGQTTSCTAASSAGDWTGAKSSASSSEVVTIPSNTSTSTQSRTYTMTCTGIGEQSVSVSTNISPDAFMDRTPAFVFTANGGTDVTIPTGTPVDLSWRVQNISGDSCYATSDGSYADWGKTYTKSLDPLTSAQQTQLNTWTSQLATDQAQITALNAMVGATSTTAVINTLQDQIASTKGLIATLTASTTAVQSQISANASAITTKQTNIQAQTNVINTKTTYLNQLNTHLGTFSALGGDALDSFTIDQTNTEISATQDALNVANTTKAELQADVTNLQAQNTALSAAKQSYASQQYTLQKQVGAFQNQLQKTQTTTTQTDDTARQQQIHDLQAQITTLQSEIAQLNNRPYTLKVLTTGKTLKLPHFDIGPSSETYDETVGTDGSVLIGDTPITGKRVYTLTCGNLPPQSVTINTDDSGDKGNTDQALSFLVNGDTSADVTVGDSVTLSWTVANIPAGSCHATSDGSYNGWGATLTPVSHIRQPGNYVYTTNDLLTDAGGTVKAPTTDVGSDSQTFTEVVGADHSITATRTYTLQCGTLPAQTVTINVDSKPSVIFLGNGESAPSVPSGSTVDLSWEVRNVVGGSCRGTSTGGPSIEDTNGRTIDLGFPGWGGSQSRVNSNTSGTFNSGVSVSYIGTVKAPSANVGAVSQTFDETVGQDGSISSERTYTLTCNGLDGSQVSQTVVINGPDVQNNVTGTNVDSSQPCGDIDIETARIQLTNLLSTYESLTGNVYDPDKPILQNNATSSIAELANGGIQTDPNSNNPYHQTGQGYFESCANDTRNGTDFMNNPAHPTRVDPHVFNTNIFPQYNQDIGDTSVFKRDNTFLPMWDWTDRTSSPSGDSMIQGTSFVLDSSQTNGSSGTPYCNGVYIGDIVDLISFTPVGSPCNSMTNDNSHIGLPPGTVIGNISDYPIPVVKGDGFGSSANYDADSFAQGTQNTTGSGSNGFQVGYNNSNHDAAWWLYDPAGSSNPASNVLARYSLYFDESKPTYTLTSTTGTASGTLGLLDAYSCNGGQGCGTHGDSRRVFYYNNWFNFYNALQLY